MNDSSDRIVLFDGLCNLCSSSVIFIIQHDTTGLLKFASLQSPIGERLRKQYNIPAHIDSIIFIENNQAYLKSAAVFQIINYFKGSWKLLKIFRLFPVMFTNFFYDIVARNRYKWFGKKDACMLPTPANKGRFMDV